MGFGSDDRRRRGNRYDGADMGNGGGRSPGHPGRRTRVPDLRPKSATPPEADTGESCAVTATERELRVDALDNIADEIRGRMSTLLTARYAGIDRFATQSIIEDPGAQDDGDIFAQCVADALLSFPTGLMAEGPTLAIFQVALEVLRHGIEAALKDKPPVTGEPSQLLRFFQVQQDALLFAQPKTDKEFSRAYAEIELAVRRDPASVDTALESLKALVCALDAQIETAAEDQYWASLQAWCVYLARSALGTTEKGSQAKAGVQAQAGGEGPVSTDMSGAVAVGPTNALSDGWSKLTGGVLDLEIAIDWPQSDPFVEIPYDSADVPTVPVLKSARITKVHTAFYEEIKRHRIADMRIPVRLRIPEHVVCVGRDENGRVWLDGYGAGLAFLDRLAERVGRPRDAMEGARYVVAEIGKLSIDRFEGEA